MTGVLPKVLVPNIPPVAAAVGVVVVVEPNNPPDPVPPNKFVVPLADVEGEGAKGFKDV